MGVKEKRGSPVILKIGVALVFSIGGIVYTFFRNKQRMIKKTSKTKPPLSSPGACSQGDDDHALQELPPSRNDSHCVDRDESVLDEFNHFLNEYDQNDECNREIRILCSKVKFLEERERILETQLLEYYGLKEQETAVAELQNRLRLQSMETKLYKIKIESLQSENRKFEAQAADYAKVVTELEDAKAKIKLLRKKLMSEAKENREQILKLQERVMKLQDREKKDVEIVDQDVETEVQKRTELEQELEEVKKTNHSLKLENIELAEKLESLQMITTSALDDGKIEALKEESQQLRQENEDSRKEIEQLQEGRCTDLEELVYLRWINACLRYELRNYQPGQGETVARDLSRTLSPKSEEKAKQLILEYADKEGYGDFDQWSTSQFTDSDDFPSAEKRNHSGKKRVFAKLLKLLQGKDNDHRAQTPASPLDMDDDTVSRTNSYSGSDSAMKMTRTRTVSEASSRQSFDFDRSHWLGRKSAVGESGNCSRRTSSDSFMRIFRRIEYDDGSGADIQPHQDAENAARTELVKYAEALKNSRGKSLVHRRSASLGII